MDPAVIKVQPRACPATTAQIKAGKRGEVAPSERKFRYTIVVIDRIGPVDNQLQIAEP
jgi:hypothetical protein